MKPTSDSSDVKPPGALALETLGGPSAISTETSSTQSHDPAELVVEFEDTKTPSSANNAPPGSAAKAGKKPKPVRSLAGTFRVLVADDSPSVRELLSRAFTAEGYEVVLAANGQEALQKYMPGLIDLVLLDLEMPVKTGWDVFEEIVALDDDQAIILMADRLDAVDLTTTGHLTRLAEKPVNLTALLAAVRKALGETSDAHRTAITSQHSLMRYAKPYVPKSIQPASYEHWGINE